MLSGTISRHAGKKIIIYLTIASLLNLVGCYYHQMNPEEYNFNEKDDIQITTKDTTYSLSAKDYHYDMDTLYATSLKIVDKNHHKVKYNVTAKIPVKDIEKLEIVNTDVASTTWIVVGVVVIVAVTLTIILIDAKFDEM